MMMEGGLMEFFGKGTTTRLKFNVKKMYLIWLFRFIDDQEEKKETLVNFFVRNIQNK